MAACMTVFSTLFPFIEPLVTTRIGPVVATVSNAGSVTGLDRSSGDWSSFYRIDFFQTGFPAPRIT